MRKFAEIAVNIYGVEGVFDYRIPTALADIVAPGCLVEVPYNQLHAQGIIVRVKHQTAFHGEIKTIIKLLQDDPVIPSDYLLLALKLADYFYQPVTAFLQAMLPTGVSQQPYVLYKSIVPDDADLTGLSKTELRLLDMLEKRGSLRTTQIDYALRRTNWRKAVTRLQRRGWIESETVLPAPKTSRKKVHTVMLHPDVDPQRLDEANTGRVGGDPAKRRTDMLRILAREEAPVQTSYLYASCGGNANDIRFLVKKGLVLTGEESVVRDPVENMQPEGTRAPSLTEDQKHAWRMIKHALHSRASKPIMLRGITGSGKTELYMKAAEETTRQGKQALILVPEIALTPQTIERFLDRFPGKVGVFHSRMSDGERFDTWIRARQGKLSVLIGPRSALLVPLKNIGLIVLDECHDDSYYQQGQVPLYDSRDGAVFLSETTRACVIFGSATPNVSRYFEAEHAGWPMIELQKRISSSKDNLHSNMTYLPLPAVNVVDMREELKNGNTSIFSMALQNTLKDTIHARQQAILFLNRRGSATIIFCRDCGFTAVCPRCDFPLTYHTGSGCLMCHTCGYSRKMLEKCPHCSSQRIRQYGMGTEKVETMLHQLIPGVRVLRWDADSVRGRNAESVILSHFKNHNADVLVGTQMLAKGLDLPLVTLVGMVLADVGLSFPDYRSSEHAFQLLTQVAGRAGRSELGGKAILQTFQPDNYVIQLAAQHDFSGFYREELDRRRKIQYPPYTRLIRFETRDLYAEKAESRALRLAQVLRQRINESADRTLEMIGPVPPYFARQSGYYRWQIILKGNDPGAIIDGDLSLTNWKIAVNPPRLL